MLGLGGVGARKYGPSGEALGYVLLMLMVVLWRCSDCGGVTS